MENNEGNTGVEKEDIIKFVCGESSYLGRWYSQQIDGVKPFWWRKHLREQNAALIAALKELIDISEKLIFTIQENRDYYWMDTELKQYKSAIERAKKLTDEK